jgi:hypothetical protein
MNYPSVIFEVLNALAATASIVGFILDRWEKYKRQRMTQEEIEKAGGNRP